jgi:hypothetical protein
MRHKWTEHGSSYGYSSRATCERCGIERMKRHAGGYHWTEWKRPDGTYIDTDKTPACEPVEQPAEAGTP